MSYRPSNNWEEELVDISEAQPLKQDASVMREFLESGVEFKWPEKLGGSSGNHCDIVGSIPLKWNRKISDKTNASIDKFEAGPDFSFQKPFVVKTIRDPDSQKARKITAKEVENMKDLRHPHVSALLATFTHQARLNILIFPAACCDLHQFMKGISKDFDEDRVTSLSDGTNTISNDTTNPRQPRDSKVGSVSKHKEKDPQEVRSEPWPLKEPIDKQFEMLRGYFVCLLQALSYLHTSGVRHKDIKPGNILIDESGSVILTDFGISRRFPKHTSHATNNEKKFTRKYASPEIMDDRNVLRDDPSDVFSLGCVFLEMATLLLGKNLDNLSDHYAIPINDTSKEEAYHRNLRKVHSWIDHLRTSSGFRPVQEHRIPGEINNDQNLHAGGDNHMATALIDIRQMLDETPSNRPVSAGLWRKFQHISAIVCRDCDPRCPDRWKPSDRQQRDSQAGLNNRRSLHAKEEFFPRSTKASVSRDLDCASFSTLTIPNQSSRRSRRESFPSASQQKHGWHGHTRTKSEPESPILQMNENIREGCRPIGSPSPVPKTQAILVEANPITAQAIAVTSPANVVDESFIQDGRKISNDVESARPPQISKPQVTHLGLPRRRSIRQNQQGRAFNRRRVIGEDNSASELQKYTESPQMRIIVYDVLQTKAYDTAFASLEGAYILPSQQRLLRWSCFNVSLGQLFKKYPLPKFRQRVEIGDRADLIAKVDLRRLKLKTQMRRWMGGFPFIYVLNYAAQPLQTENRLDPGG